MRLIIKEYVAQLKEKDELDVLISEIFVQKGYIADNLPKTGNRQYGVDVQLHNKSELLLFVIKQGDIDRKVWNDGVNSVRQSLDEIKDVKINLLTDTERKKRIRIIVATNGIRSEAIITNWSGYVNNNRKWNGKPINIEFMGIDDIVNEILENFFNEYLFDSEIRSSMRKALYFIDEGDYKRRYYQEIVDSTILKIKDTGKKKREYRKACATLYLASQMICQYANDVGNTKVAIDVSEFVIIKYWKYLVEENLLGKIKYIEWLYKFFKCYERWNEAYVQKIEKIVNKEIILPNYNVVENRVLLYEILGYLSSYGNYLLDVKPERTGRVLNAIVGILNEYEYFVYAPYDVSINVVIMIYKLLFYFNRKDEIRYLLKIQTETLMNYYNWKSKFPAPSDTFEEAMEIEMNEGNVEYDVSAFWGYCLLLIYYLDDQKLYEKLQEFLRIKLEKVSKCVWFLRKDEELKFYEYWAMNSAGEGTEITVEDEFEMFKEKVTFILAQYEDEKFTFDEYSFPSLECIICHYYNYIPRVKFIQEEKEKKSE